MSAGSSARRYGPYTVETSNEDKVLYPGEGITKGDVIEYYERIAPIILRWLARRPLVMQRYPDGIEQEGFYQKAVPEYFPEWIERAEVSTAEGRQTLVVAANAATLAYLANQACLTVHPWLSRRDRLRRPDQLIFDLDPPGEGFEPVRWAAGRLRELLEEIELPCYVKATGSRGLHVMVPLDRSADFDAVRAFARRVAAVLAGRHPDRLTTEQRKASRGSRLYLDTGRNAYGQTAVAPYALRARPGAPVAAPLDWEELAERDLTPRTWTLRNVFRRLGQRDDPWSGAARRARGLKAAGEALARLEQDA